MANQELLDYIMRQRSHGANSENIKEALLKAGWDPKEVEVGIATTEPTATPVPTSVSAPTTTVQPVVAPVTSPVVAAVAFPATPTLPPNNQPMQPLGASPVMQPVMATPVAAPSVIPQQLPSMNPAAMSQTTMHPSMPTGGAMPQSPVYVAPQAAMPAATPVGNPVAPLIQGSSMPLSGSAIQNQPVAVGAVRPMTPPVAQIPSANFMPKIATAPAGPVIPPVTSVMPNTAILPPAKKSPLGIIFAIVLLVILFLGGGGFAYWKYFRTPPAPLTPSEKPVVQDVVVTPDVVPVTTDNTAPEGGMIAFPSSIQATTTEVLTTTTTKTTVTSTSTVSAPAPSPKKTATSSSVLPAGAK